MIWSDRTKRKISCRVNLAKFKSRWANSRAEIAWQETIWVNIWQKHCKISGIRFPDISGARYLARYLAHDFRILIKFLTSTQFQLLKFKVRLQNLLTRPDFSLGVNNERSFTTFQKFPDSSSLHRCAVKQNLSQLIEFQA